MGTTQNAFRYFDQILETAPLKPELYCHKSPILQNNQVRTKVNAIACLDFERTYDNVVVQQVSKWNLNINKLVI